MPSVEMSVAMAYGGVRLPASATLTAESPGVPVEVSVATGQTAFHVNLNVDVSQLKCFIWLSDRVVTIKTNSSGSPDETIVLAANVPLMWFSGPTVDGSALCPLPTDITDLYIANASGQTATVKFWHAQDATP